MKLKKMFCMAMTMVLLLSAFSACNSATPTPTATPAATPKATQTTAPSSTTPAPAEETGKLATIADMVGGNVKANPKVKVIAQQAINNYQQAAFDEYASIYGAGTVDVTVVGWNKIGENIQLGMSSGDQYDLCFIEGNPNMPGYVNNKLVQPIDRYLNLEKGMQYMDTISLKQFELKGNYYTFTNASITQPYVFAYNATIFEEEGLETPGSLFDKGLWTQQKMCEYIEYFTRDLNGDGEFDQWGTNNRFKWQNMMYANDGWCVWVNDDGSLTSNVGSKENIQAYEFITNFMKAAGKLADFNNTKLIDRSVVFYGEAWLQDGGASVKPQGSTDVFDFVPIPTYDGRVPTTPCWDCGWGIPEGAKNPDAGAVLAELICKNYYENFRATLEDNLSDEQIARLDIMMSKTIGQQRGYPNVTMVAGNGEARDGMPAASIVEKYKSQVEEECRVYNQTYVNN